MISDFLKRDVESGIFQKLQISFGQTVHLKTEFSNLLGDLDESNWRLCIDAVEHCLNSWRSHQLSYGDKPLIINALDLSRVWYVTSLVPMPLQVLDELNALVFKFFWSRKRDLVVRNVVIHPRDSGGFSVVAVQLKVFTLRTMGSAFCVLSECLGFSSDRFGVDPLFFSNPSIHLPGCSSPILCAP